MDSGREVREKQKSRFRVRREEREWISEGRVTREAQDLSRREVREGRQKSAPGRVLIRPQLVRFRLWSRENWARVDPPSSASQLPGMWRMGRFGMARCKSGRVSWVRYQCLLRLISFRLGKRKQMAFRCWAVMFGLGQMEMAAIRTAALNLLFTRRRLAKMAADVFGSAAAFSTIVTQISCGRDSMHCLKKDPCCART